MQRIFCATLALALILTSPAMAEDRPGDCSGIPWCGCWLRHHFGLTDTRLNAALLWPRLFGHRIRGPEIGAVGVFKRRRGGHVGVVTELVDATHVRMKSGNDGGAVRDRVRSTRGIVAWLAP